jgi:hypothetical protein
MLNQKGEDSREQIGFYCMDDLVPQDHLLRKIEKAINFSFIYDLVKDRYSEDTGRPSIEYRPGSVVQDRVHPVFIWNPQHAADNQRHRGQCGIPLVFGV